LRHLGGPKEKPAQGGLQKKKAALGDFGNGGPLAAVLS
jgi:hypothetical protein